MGIAALPPSVARTVRSSQALTDPAALVKELVENSLDARATSVSVEISSNTIDLLQVRDNGHGIPPDDRHLVAKRHCTSKIATLSDLNKVGGSSLGFRGEALASAAQLSGSLTITTRVDGEDKAVAMQLDREGNVLAESGASAAVGTTVRVTDFITANPVRKKLAIKNSERCLKSIRRTLQALAMARPYVRLSLKVMKSKHAHADWIYAPKTGAASVEDAVCKILGQACASQCISRRHEEGGFRISSVLPTPEAQGSNIGGFGCFLSIDARPVSAARGTIKHIAKLYHDALRRCGKQELGAVKDPFLQLDLSCPPGSYDVNVEPAKDSVLFEDCDAVLELLKQFFISIYPPRNDLEPEVSSGLEASVVAGHTHNQGGESSSISSRSVLTKINRIQVDRMQLLPISASRMPLGHPCAATHYLTRRPIVLASTTT